MNESPRWRKVGIFAAVAAGLMIFSSALQGAIVDPSRSGTASLSGITSAQRPELAGIILADSSQPFQIHNAAGELLSTGTLRQQVVRETGTKTLDFYYQLTSTGGTHSLNSLWAYGFQPGKLDLDYRSDSTAGAPHPKRGSALADGAIAAFDFEDGPNVAAGQSSAMMFVHTRSKAFVNDAAGVAIVFANHLPGDSDLENFVSANLSVARPVPVPIPLPPAIFASLTVMLPLGALFVWRRRAAAKSSNT